MGNSKWFLIFLAFFSMCYLPFLSHSHHTTELDRITVILMLTQHKHMTSVSKGKKKTDVCFCGNDTEQLLSPHTFSLLRFWWLGVVLSTYKFSWLCLSLGPVLRPGFLAAYLLMTRPFLAGLRVVDRVSVIDHRHLRQEYVSLPEKL